MEDNLFNLNNKIYSNNNILLEIINELNQIKSDSNENLTIQRLGNIINKMNYMINENKKNVQLIRNDISSLYNKMNKRFDELDLDRFISELNYFFKKCQGN